VRDIPEVGQVTQGENIFNHPLKPTEPNFTSVTVNQQTPVMVVANILLNIYYIKISHKVAAFDKKETLSTHFIQHKCFRENGVCFQNILQTPRTQL
jgi:hypothetical protein